MNNTGKLSHNQNKKQLSNKVLLKNLKKIGINILALFPCSFVFFFITRIFFSSSLVAIVVTILSALCFYRLIFRFLEYYKNQDTINNYILFLQALNNHLNLSRSLILSISLAIEDLIKLKKNKNLNKKLQKVQRSMELSLPFSEIIDLLKQAFPCRTANTSLSLMSAPQVIGNNIYIFAKNTFISLQNNETFKKEVVAEQAKNFIETITICSMPAVILTFLRSTAKDFVNLAYTSTLGQLMLGVAYFLFFLGLVFTVLVYIPKTNSNKLRETPKFLKNRIKLVPQRMNYWLQKNSLSILVKTTCPFQLSRLFRYSSLFDRQEQISPETLYTNLLLARVKFFMFALILVTIGIILKLPILLILILFITIISFPDYKLIDRGNYYLRKIKIDMQSFITALLSALNVGYTLEAALLFCQKYGNLNDILTKEISIIISKINNSSTTEKSISEFIDVLDDRDIENFFYLVQNHTKTNNYNSMKQLELQFERIKEKFFYDRKKLLALKSNNYLLPLMLNLLSIFLICLAPVLPSLQI